MVWVDTDFGFDDLWAVLLLHRAGIPLAGVSLVAGNAPLEQVYKNAVGASAAYDLTLPLFLGADKPLIRAQETATRILGPTGIRTLGQTLPSPQPALNLSPALPALKNWLEKASPDDPREILALGPLTNLAQLITTAPKAAQKITRLIWMGGSKGRGNHTPHAEFNAFADPEAARIVADANLPLDVVDLTLCRQATFDASDCPTTDALTADLLGGYLQIALERGRDKMAIYDPVAALTLTEPALFDYQSVTMHVAIEPGAHYGATRFEPSSASRTRLVTSANPNLSRLCLGALKQEGHHGN